MWLRSSLVLLLACGGPTEPLPVDTDPIPQDTGPFVPTLPPPPTGTDPCASLVIQAPTEAPTLYTVPLTVVGGIGPFTWSIETNLSGGAINAATGAWFTGPVAAVDTLAVYDEGCDLTDTVDIAIYPFITADPSQAQVPPGTVLTLTASVASYECTEGVLSGGSTLVGCVFTAGSVGANTVIVTDLVSGQFVEVDITVAEGVTLVDPPVLLVPVGYPTPLVPSGGSGTLSATHPAVTLANGLLTATAPGTHTVTVEDPLTGLTQPITVVASSPLSLDPTTLSRDGETQDWGQISSIDLDGDGLDEAIVSTPHRGLRARGGGSVFIYPGTATGPGPLPLQTLGSEQPDAQAGHSHAVGDFDGDGSLDLAVGEHLWDAPGSASVGRVQVYRGLGTGLFDTTSPWTLVGTGGSDTLGYAVAACDVNEDGYDDLIAGAPGLDDDSVSPTVQNTGGLHLYLGSATGLPATPSRIWYGGRVNGDGRNAEAGTSLAVGDIDGDGGCDVAVGSRIGDAFDEGSSRGGVWILRDEELLAAPTAAWRVIGVPDTSLNNIELGVRVAFLPVAGSEFDAVVASARLEPALGNANAGAVHVYRSETLRDATGMVDGLVDADWSFFGATSNDNIGLGLAVAPGGTLHIGGPRATPAAGGGERGVVFTATVDFAAPDPILASDVPAVDGVDSGGFFGAVVAQSTGGVLILGSRVDHPLDVPAGVQDGAFYLHDGVDLIELELPTEPVGALLGTSVAWFDVDGGGPDAVAGAPGFSAADQGTDVGAVVAWSAGQGAATVRPPLLQNAEEALGGTVTDLGDLNGDGFADLAVVATRHNVGSPLDASFALGACPDVSRSQAGAAYIYLGSGTGLRATPDFAIFGVDANQRVQTVSRALDFDGDGQRGLAVATREQDTVWMYDGPWSPIAGQIVVRCDPETTLVGPDGSDFGTLVEAVPSVDGDFCDELVVTAQNDDIGGTNRGSVRLFRGCAAAGVSWKTWIAGVNNQRLGTGGLAVGDLTNNGTADVAVGSTVVDGVATDIGAVWFLSEADLGLPTMVWDHQAATGDFAGTPETGTVPGAQLNGSTVDERFGAALAVSSNGANARLLIGRPGADQGAGGVDGWSMNAGGFVARTLQVGSEGPYAALGSSLAARGNTVVVGAPDSSAVGVGNGAVYVFDRP